MNRSIGFLNRAIPVIGGLLFVAGLASCGGGVVGSGGTGITTGMAVGTVNGFGSVIVDGVAYDDRGAPVVSEVAPGQDAVSEVKLGDRVAVQYRSVGVAGLVRVEAALSGSVASAVSDGQFSMLGQTVAINTRGAAGPITQLGGGYSQVSDLRVGDAVEVHGVLVRQTGAYQIQATRIERLPRAPAYLRVTGVVDDLGSDRTFSLGVLKVDASSAAVLPASTALARGQMVTVLALPSRLTTPAGGLRMDAAQVRIRELSSGGLEDSLSGSVSHLDVLARTLSLGGVLVDYSAAVMAPATAMPANGQYVLVRGKAVGAGLLLAASLTVRDAGSDSEAALRGNSRSYDPANVRFFVRDVLVDASGAVTLGCPTAGPTNGQFVAVEGSLNSTGVLARKVRCEDEPPDAQVERDGVAGAVDIAGATF